MHLQDAEQEAVEHAQEQQAALLAAQAACDERAARLDAQQAAQVAETQHLAQGEAQLDQQVLCSACCSSDSKRLSGQPNMCMCRWQQQAQSSVPSRSEL